jgi:recombination protein RecA
LDVRRIGQIKDANDVTGNRVKVKVVKNKVAAPFREAEFDIIFNEGVSLLGEIIDIGSDKGIIDKAGAWFSYKGERIGQGREGAKQFLRENPEMAKEIRSLILDSHLAGATPKQLADATNEDLTITEKTSKSKKKAVANG